MEYLVKLCGNAGVRNIDGFHWVILVTTSLHGYKYRALKSKAEFNKFLLNIGGSKIIYVYVDYKTEVDGNLNMYLSMNLNINLNMNMKKNLNLCFSIPRTCKVNLIRVWLTMMINY